MHFTLIWKCSILYWNVLSASYIHTHSWCPTATWIFCLFHQSYRHDSDIRNEDHGALKSIINSTSFIQTEQMNWKFHQPLRALKVLMFDNGDSIQAAWQSNKSLKWFGDHQSLLCKVFMKWNYQDLLPWYNFQLPQALRIQFDLLCYLWHWSILQIVAIGFMFEPNIKVGNKSRPLYQSEWPLKSPFGQ